MKKRIKSYLVFTSSGYRVWGLMVIPALLLAATYLIFSDIAQDVGWGLYAGGSVILFFEIFSDYWLFGGICSRQMEYLKTSSEGKVVLRNALTGDLLRRFLYIMVFSTVCYGKSHKLEAYSVGLMIYLVAVGILNITRNLPGVIQQMRVTFLVTILFSAYGVATSDMHGGMIEFILLIAASAAVSMVTVWHVLWKVKGSYYEKESEKGN